MWVIAKINKESELTIFKSELNKKIKDKFKVEYYFPKIIVKNKISTKTKNILGNYIFCFHEKFDDLKNILSIKYIKGLNYFLDNAKNSQREIKEFISLCKKNENPLGYLDQSFFRDLIFKKGKFINSPLSNLVFEIINNNKKYLEILLGNKQIKISKNSNILYLPA